MQPGDKQIPTLADVAERAGVSTATVSRCLNTPDRVIERTRERVMRAVQELGYAPNFNARALAARRSSTFGAVIPTMENAIFARGLQAFQEELHRHGITLLVASSQYQPEVEEEQVQALVARGADALLLIGYDRSKALYDFLRKRGVPVAVAWAFDPNTSLATIGFDNHAAMSELAEIVLEKGHRKIAVISANLQGNDRARARVEAIHSAMQQAGIAEAPRLVEVTYGVETGAQAFREIMTSGPKPTVVMCGNDVIAVGAMQAAREMGLSVPDDVSITGFDDIELARVVTPALTTVHVPHKEMGLRAAQMLVAMTKEGAAPQAQKLTTTVAFRGTLARV